MKKTVEIMCEVNFTGWMMLMKHWKIVLGLLAIPFIIWLVFA